MDHFASLLSILALATAADGAKLPPPTISRSRYLGRRDVAAIGVTAHDGTTKQAYRVVLSR